MTPICREVQK